MHIRSLSLSQFLSLANTLACVFSFPPCTPPTCEQSQVFSWIGAAVNRVARARCEDFARTLLKVAFPSSPSATSIETCLENEKKTYPLLVLLFFLILFSLSFHLLTSEVSTHCALLDLKRSTGDPYLCLLNIIEQISESIRSKSKSGKHRIFL